MATTIVSLVSEQTIPNVQFIKEFAKQADSFLFISTEKMEDKKASRSEWIKKACLLAERKCKTILVDHTDLNDIELKVLDTIDLKQEYLVNLTGGNKLTALACFNVFREMSNAKIFYINIGTQAYEQIFPKPNERIKQLFEEQVSIIEYLTAYGMSISERETKWFNLAESERLFHRIIQTSSNFNEIDEIRDAHIHPDPFMRQFYAGGWFEEYIYARIKSSLKTTQGNQAYKVKLTKGGNGNEYDVVFMRNNEIHVVECKAFTSTSNPANLKAKLDASLFKLAALNDDFGLRVKSVFITTLPLRSINPALNQTIQSRAAELGITFLQLNDLNSNFLKMI